MGVQDATPAQFIAAASSATVLKESAPVVPLLKASDFNLQDILKHGSAAASNVVVVSHSVQELEDADAGGWVKALNPNPRSRMAPSNASSIACSTKSTNFYKVLEDGPSELPIISIPIGILSDSLAVRSAADILLIPSEQ